MSEFCDECGITMDLHSGEDSCDLAEQKVNMMNRFFSFAVRS